MAFLQGKKILITGLLSNRSIAYGIAEACKREGAELAFTYVGERFKDRITEFAKEFDSDLVFDCDVGSDEQINALFADLGKSWDRLDGLVHAIGFAPREAISGDFLEGLSREGFKIAHDISSYLIQLPRDGQSRATDVEPECSAADPDLSWFRARAAQLQHDGLGESFT
jgi:enoyl-[acyl-carrier protein] reductase I